MNRERYAGICKQLMGTIRQGWGRLVNDPRIEDAGAHELHAGKIQARYGLTQEQAAHDLEDFFARNRRWDITHR